MVSIASWGVSCRPMYPFTDEAKRNAVTPTKMPLGELLQLTDFSERGDKELIARAYEFAKEKHEGQVRYSGAPYFHHPFETAKYLAAMRMPASMIVSGLLHDIVEDAGVDVSVIEELFGKDIAVMVEGVTKLGHIRYQGLNRHTESLRKLFAATSRDMRVIVVKLADRLHNARTLQFVPEHKRERIALETLEIYAPIADRLGVGLLRRELEDGVFPHAYPKECKEVSKIFKQAGGEDVKKLGNIRNVVRKIILNYGIREFSTDSRAKGLYSLFRKLERKDWDITRIYDIWALRIIVPTVSDCYVALSVIHAEWIPLPGRLKDYIALPKPNGYRSIHTTVHTGLKNGGVIEIQIRTREMHREAELGIASHLAYKDANGSVKESPAVRWIKHFVPTRLFSHNNEDPLLVEGGQALDLAGVHATPEWIRHIAESNDKEVKNPNYFLREIKADFFNHRVFVFTPRGEVIDLPIDSSPIDFAYAIHSDIGDTMTGAKINGKLSSLDSKLKNGDIVHILTSSKACPSKKWIDMAKTTLAKRHIRSYLHRSRRATK